MSFSKDTGGSRQPPSPYSDLPEVVPEDDLPSYEAATRSDLLRQTAAVQGMPFMLMKPLW